MNSNENIVYVESELNSADTASVKQPIGKGITSLVLGILSVLLNPLGIVGLILGSLACKLSGVVIADFEGMISAKLARWGKGLGVVGIVLSTISFVFAVTLIALLIYFAVSYI